MGILNVTPDSFSDGGLHFTAESAIAAGLQMLDEGADILDVGGESTRPGATPVDEEEELRRVMPVIRELCRRDATVSVDTMKPEVARQALEVGAQIVNDVTGLRHPGMKAVCTEAKATVCLMHMQGNPRSMQALPHYEDVVLEVKQFLVEGAEELQAFGMLADQIWIDPGIGFGKTDEHNFTLLRNVSKLVETGFPVMIGVSRKGFIGRALASEGKSLPANDRLEGTLALHVAAQLAGVKILRAHDVRASRRAIDITAGL
jgi:dihydropteroate synthase